MAFSTGRNNHQSPINLEDYDAASFPPILWTADGAAYGAPVFEYNNLVFTMKGQGGDINLGNPHRELIQLDLVTGAENWAVELPLSGGVFSGCFPIGITSTGLYVAASMSASFATGNNFIYFLSPTDGSIVATSAVEIFTGAFGCSGPLITVDGDVVGAGKGASYGNIIRIAGYARDSFAIGDVVWEGEPRVGTLGATTEESNFTELTDGTIIFTSPYVFPPNEGFPKGFGMQIVARDGDDGTNIQDRQIQIGADYGYYCPATISSTALSDGKDRIGTLASNRTAGGVLPFNWAIDWEYTPDAGFTLIGYVNGVGVPNFGAWGAQTRALETLLLRPTVVQVDPLPFNGTPGATATTYNLSFCRTGMISREVQSFANTTQLGNYAGWHYISDQEDRGLILSRTQFAGTFGMIVGNAFRWQTNIQRSSGSSIEIANDGKILINCNNQVICYDPDGTEGFRPPGDLINP